MSNEQKILFGVWVVFSFTVLLSTFPPTAALHEIISPILLEWVSSKRQLSPGQIDYWTSATRDLSLLGLFACLAVALNMRHTSWWLLFKFIIFLCVTIAIFGIIILNAKIVLVLLITFSIGIFVGLLYWPITTPVRHLLLKAGRTSPS